MAYENFEQKNNKGVISSEVTQPTDAFVVRGERYDGSPVDIKDSDVVVLAPKGMNAIRIENPGNLNVGERVMIIPDNIGSA